jgi:predicted dienelactone hydrolase
MRTVMRVLGIGLGVMLLLLAALGIYIYLTALKPTSPVGFQQAAANDPGPPSVPRSIWYPTNDKPGFVLMGTTGERVASDGAVAGSALPLIVISHGTAGGAMSHADTALALAEQGFVVAAITHPGDNFRDQSDVGKPAWLANRARHISRVIDFALGSWKDRLHLDPNKVGVFGLSAGATAALIEIGGTPDLSRIVTHCAEHPEFVCQVTPPDAYRNLKAATWTADPRIRAAVIAAPGLGFTFQPDGLAKVRVPVQLWSGNADQTVPFATNAGVVARLLPVKPELRQVPGAVHFSFLAPCGLIGPPQFCRDPKGFDRIAFHKEFNQAVAGFFKKEL